MPRTPFKCFVFWRVPRFFCCSVNGTQLALISEFDDLLDVYKGEYKVYELPPGFDTESLASWVDSLFSESSCLGTIPIAEMEFDSTKKLEIEVSPILKLLGGQGANSV